ncbi:DUF1176 domain-containing protein [Pseudomonas sp. R2.Fl]|nr:DUF1176 domain-containing protein [Pseudomonas sp. R2.Fl]
MRACHIARMLVATIAVAAGLSQQPALASAYKKIRDWTVSCDMAMRCAMNYDNIDVRDFNSFSITRSSAPNAPLELILPFPPAYRTTKDPNGRFVITVDGREVFSRPITDMAEDRGNWRFSYSGNDLFSLAEAMKTGTGARLSYTGDLGPLGLDIPLAGVTGSLLFIDEAQGRLDRVDALQAKGDKPAPERAAVTPVGYDDIPASIRGDFESESDRCHVEEERRSDFTGIEIRGEEGARLLLMPCNTPGAYNQPYAAYNGHDDDLLPTAFPMMTEEGPSTALDAYNLDYDPTTRTISSFYKGRGIGDCGTLLEWTVDLTRWDGVLVLKQQRTKDDCDGQYVDPQEWPALWPVSR